MSEKVLITKELRARIAELEYKDLPVDRYIQEIERIYIEEIGEPLPAKVKILKSSESSVLMDDDSGYDGSAIHFISDDGKINEVYVVSEGSQKWVDWNYNIQGLFAGLDSSQARATNQFVKESLNEFGLKRIESNQVYEIPVIGLSHSLAHNNNATAHLVYDTFTKVHSVNGAQTNYFQLFFEDEYFRRELSQHYPVLFRNRMQIYSLNPKELEAIAQDFYKDKAKNIHQDISYDDPLYWVSGVRGFFELGTITKHDTNPRLGLRKLIDKISDSIVMQLQTIAIDYTIASKKGGVNQVLQDLVGIDIDFAEDFKYPHHYITKQGEISDMVSNVNELLPGLLEVVQLITNNADLIFEELTKRNYITGEQKKELVSIFQNFEADLLEIEKAINGMSSSRKSLQDAIPSNALGNLSSMIAADLKTLVKVKKAANSILEYLEVFKKKEYVKLANEVAAGHGIADLLERMSTGNKRYLGDDLLYRSLRGGKTIWVNISAAFQMYSHGKSVIEEKQQSIRRLIQTLDQEIFDYYERRKQETLRQIDRMEENPNAYQNKLAHYGFYPSRKRTIIRLGADDHIHSLRHADMDYEISQLQKSVDNGYLLIEQSREAIESLFDEEMKISQRFDLMEEFYNGS